MIPENIRVLLTGIDNYSNLTIDRIIDFSVSHIKGIGEKYSSILYRHGIKKIRDLLELDFDEIDISEKLLNKWSIAATIIRHSKSSQSGGKIIFSGLSKAGKTSIVYNLKSITHPPEVTTGVSQEFVKLAGNNVKITDMGGQERFRDIYLTTPDLYFSRTKLLFYVIDVQDKSKLERSIEYLERVLAIYRYLKEKPFISILYHKYDPDKVYDLKYDLPPIKEQIRTLFVKFSEFKYEEFTTSIYNPPSIFIAIASTLSRVFPVMSILSDLLEEFAEIHGFDGLLLMDDQGMLIGQYLSDFDYTAVITKSYGAYKEVKEKKVHSFSPIVLRKNVENPPGQIIIQQIFLPQNNGYIIYWTRADNPLDLTEYMISELSKALNPWLYNLLAS